MGIAIVIQDHWSILISGEIHMDQSLVHTFSWGNSYGPMVLKLFLEFPPILVVWSMDGSSQRNSCSENGIFVVASGFSHNAYPLTRNYYENNSLRIIFRNF